MLWLLALGSSVMAVPSAGKAVLERASMRPLERVLLAQIDAEHPDPQAEADLEEDMREARRRFRQDQEQSQEQESVRSEAPAVAPKPAPSADDEQDARALKRERKRKTRMEKRERKRRMRIDRPMHDGKAKGHYMAWTWVDWGLAAGFWAGGSIFAVYSAAFGAAGVRQTWNTEEGKAFTIASGITGVVALAAAGIGALFASKAVRNEQIYRQLKAEEMAMLERDAARGP